MVASASGDKAAHEAALPVTTSAPAPAGRRVSHLLGTILLTYWATMAMPVDCNGADAFTARMILTSQHWSCSEYGHGLLLCYIHQQSKPV